jgi:1,4-alpha-glucan branching enzyme
LDNVRHWLEHYHFDGLRLDAIHYLFDSRQPSLLAEIGQTVRHVAETTGRQRHCIAETNVFDPTLPPEYAAQWADCLLHAVYSLGTPQVRLTNRPYHGAEDVAVALRQGYVYQGSAARDYQRPLPRAAADTEPESPVHAGLVVSLQTHDSVGNHPHGQRLHHLTSVDFQRAAAALALLAPSIPQLFMGEEGSVASPFCFFADFGDPGLRAAVDRGRQHEYPHHTWDDAPLPSDPAAFFSSGLSDRATWDPVTLAWYRWLLQLRRAGVEGGWLRAERAVWSHTSGSPYYKLEYHTDTLVCRVESWLWPPESKAAAAPVGLYGAVTSMGELVQQTWPLDRDAAGPAARARVTLWPGAVALEPLSVTIP